MPIDKPTPNVSETVVEVPKQEELIQERDEIIEKKNQQGNIEVTMDEEGGAEIAFDPRAVTEEGGQDQMLMLGLAVILLIAGIALFIIRKKRSAEAIDFNTSTHTQIE